MRNQLATAGNGTAGQKPTSRGQPRHNLYETWARGPQRAFMRETTPSVLLLINHRRSIMSWYLAVLKKYAVFSGRARRKEYWFFLLFNIIFLIVATILDNLFKTTFENMSYGWFYLLYALAVLIPSIALEVRRLHDVGKSGWWYFIALIPLVGAIWLLVLMLTDSQPGDNKYGPNPKMMATPPMAVQPPMAQP
jgi:uncharacterized membrane protein YhaH (DUF805 family)